MPTEILPPNTTQRALADSIIKMQPLDEIRILLASGAKVNEPVTQGLRPLHYAVWQKYTLAVNLLLVRGADINATDECGYSALHLAAEHGYLELTELLLKLGAKVDYREPTDELYPRTTLCDEPLRLALRNKHYDVAKKLLEHGADPNKRYFFGAEINLVTDFESLELLLLFGANTEIEDRSGMTPLMRAVRHSRNSLAQVLLLISYGANVNAMTDARNDYRTVLHYAILAGNISLVNLLLKQGAKVDIPVPSPEHDRPSPLHLAILKGDPILVQMLLDNGANVNRCSPVIGSPLHVACADNITNRYEIMEALLKKGSNPNIRVCGEAGNNAILRSALAELLASNSNITRKELHLLLKYGARVVIKTQFRDPDGLLNYLQNLPADKPEYKLLIDAAEAFDICMIKRSTYLTETQKKVLIETASQPLTLKSQSRIYFKRYFGNQLPSVVPSFYIPECLKGYLLFDE